MSRGGFDNFNYNIFVYFLVNIVLFIALYQLIYLFEKIFGFVTDITLFELCDTNQPLLKELSVKAPGTFQHSLQVANLSEAAAKAIGANPLFARTGALYHDIGKIENPAYFIENNLLDYNPHDDINELESVAIIKNHISDGIVLAKKYNLPHILEDFINSHHAQSLIFYFYHKYKASHDDIDESQFKYLGPTPISKEATICMLADGVEAASRSLKDRSFESVSALIDSVVDAHIKEDSFRTSELSFSELSITKDVFKNKITEIYHTRIEYPHR